MTDEDKAPYDPLDLTPWVRRKIMWDILPHDEVPKLCQEAGLTPGSDEGVEWEHQESHVRLDRIEELLPTIMIYSAVIADVIGKALLRPENLKAEPTEGQVEQFTEQNYNFIRAANIAILAELVDSGILQIRS